MRLLGREGQLAESGSAPLAIPHSVRETIGRRLRHLSDASNDLLTLASVLGREFDLNVLARLSGLEQGAVLEGLDEATEARVVSEVPGAISRMRFAHALIRDAAYHRLTRARRIELHRRAGEALEAVHAAELDPHLAELAYHFYEAAASAEAVAYAARAGARAVAQLAYEEAERLYALALAALDAGGAATPAKRAELLLALGDAQGRRGDDAAAKATFLRAADVARTAELPELVARAASGYGGRFLWTHGVADDRLLPILEEGLIAVGTGDSALRVRLLSRLAAALRHGPTRTRREQLMEEAIQMARRIGDPLAIASALTAAESALHAPHTASQRLANAGEIVTLATAAGDRERLFDGHEHAFWASWELGDPDRRARELAAMTRVAEDLRQPAQLWMLAAARATLALAQGEFAEAPALIQRAYDAGARVLAWNAGAARILQLFLLRREQGTLTDYLREVADHEGSFPSPLVRHSVLAHAHARLGHAEEAASHVREITRQTVGLARRRAVARQRLPARGDLRARRRARARADRCTTSCCATAGRTPSPCRSWRWTPPAGRSGSSRPRSDASTTRSGTSGSAALMNERMGARPWLAHTRCEHARMLLQRDAEGDRGRAVELLARARELYRELAMDDDLVRVEELRVQATAGSNSDRLT